MNTDVLPRWAGFTVDRGSTGELTGLDLMLTKYTGSWSTLKGGARKETQDSVRGSRKHVTEPMQGGRAKGEDKRKITEPLMVVSLWRLPG